jgi:hypothetical protein
MEVSARDWKPTTVERYADIVRIHLTPALGTTPLGDLAPADIAACLTACTGVSPATRLKVYQILSRALNVAVYSALPGAATVAPQPSPRQASGFARAAAPRTLFVVVGTQATAAAGCSLTPTRDRPLT